MGPRLPKSPRRFWTLHLYQINHILWILFCRWMYLINWSFPHLIILIFWGLREVGVYSNSVLSARGKEKERGEAHVSLSHVNFPSMQCSSGQSTCLWTLALWFQNGSGQRRKYSAWLTGKKNVSESLKISVLRKYVAVSAKHLHSHKHGECSLFHRNNLLYDIDIHGMS